MAVSKMRRAEILLQMMKDKRFDPAAELMKLAKSASLKTEMKVKIYTDLMRYVYPTQKAVELNQNAGQPVVFNFDIAGPETKKADGLSSISHTPNNNAGNNG